MGIDEAMKEAMAQGIRHARLALEEAGRDVADENQSWRSAAAYLALFESDFRAAGLKVPE